MNAPEHHHLRHRRHTDNQMLMKWGHDPDTAPHDIVEMVQLSQELMTMRAGEAVAHLKFATREEVERLIQEKPSNLPLLEYLGDKIEGLRTEIQRILTLQNGWPYYKELGPAHPSLQDATVLSACSKLEATLITTPIGAPCLVFADHDDAKRYESMGHRDQNVDPIRKTLRRTPILAVGPRTVVLSRTSIEFTDTGELEQVHITPASATTEVQKRLLKIIEEAIHEGSSNIAIQPETKGMSVARMRVHGDMVPMKTTGAIPPEIAIEMANTLHLWSQATYTGQKGQVQGSLQGPADGKFTYRTSDGETFIRASFTLPDNLGGAKLECISLRLQPRETLSVQLPSLRLKHNVMAAIEDAMHEKRGIFLMVGGTGSGKSTTIHGALSLYRQIYGDTKNCLTIEDPVERLAQGIVSHSTSREYGFSLMMAAILRQDPDLVFLGEMRDRSSASIGIRAANSGHLVPATLHANDCFMALSALRAYISNHIVTSDADVIVSDFDLISSINLIVAQQLVPELCKVCRKPTPVGIQQELGQRITRYATRHGLIPPNKEANSEKRQEFIENVVTALKTSYQKDPDGCKECNHRGTIGELPINEFFLPDANCKQLLIDMMATNRLNFDRIKYCRPQTLFDAALERVRDGETSPDALFV